MAKILVVDDEPEIREILVGFLESLEHQVEIACDGKEAIEKIRSNSPDLVLLDVKLPDIDGTKVLKEVRSWNSELKVILITGNIEYDLAKMSQSLGVQGFVPKPFDLMQLKRMLQKIL